MQRTEQTLKFLRRPGDGGDELVPPNPGSILEEVLLIDAIYGRVGAVRRATTKPERLFLTTISVTRGNTYNDKRVGCVNPFRGELLCDGRKPQNYLLTRRRVI